MKKSQPKVRMWLSKCWIVLPIIGAKFAKESLTSNVTKIERISPQPMYKNIQVSLSNIDIEK